MNFNRFLLALAFFGSIFLAIPMVSNADDNQIYNTNDISAADIARFEERNLPPYAGWVSYNQALKNAKTNLKPILVMFTQPWCASCKQFKRYIKDYYLKEFYPMSKRFNMVSIEGEEMPKKLVDEKFSLDGAYFPRVFLMDPYGKIDQSLQEPHSWENHYAYSSPRDLLTNMATIAEKWEEVQPSKEEEL